MTNYCEEPSDKSARTGSTAHTHACKPKLISQCCLHPSLYHWAAALISPVALLFVVLLTEILTHRPHFPTWPSNLIAPHCAQYRQPCVQAIALPLPMPSTLLPFAPAHSPCPSPPPAHKVYASLAKTDEGGPEFAGAVRHVLAHEGHWVEWKSLGCPLLDRPPAQPLHTLSGWGEGVGEGEGESVGRQQVPSEPCSH